MGRAPKMIDERRDAIDLAWGDSFIMAASVTRG
jgi:hypothetical protein